MPDQEENEIVSISQDDIDQLLKQAESEPEESDGPSSWNS